MWLVLPGRLLVLSNALINAWLRMSILEQRLFTATLSRLALAEIDLTFTYELRTARGCLTAVCFRVTVTEPIGKDRDDLRPGPAREQTLLGWGLSTGRLAELKELATTSQLPADYLTFALARVQQQAGKLRSPAGLAYQALKNNYWRADYESQAYRAKFPEAACPNPVENAATEAVGAVAGRGQQPAVAAGQLPGAAVRALTGRNRCRAG